MEIDPSNPHTLWSGALTAVAGLLSLLLHRFSKEVDEKADKDVMDARFDGVDERIKSQSTALQTLLERQDEQHKANTERLDRIYSAIATRNGP